MLTDIVERYHPRISECQQVNWTHLIPVDSSWDKSASSYERDVIKTYSEVSSKLGFNVNKDTEISIISRTSGNRVKTIKIGNTYYTGVEIRNI